jgi:hypothetical protein
MGQPDINEWEDMMPHTIQVEPWLSYKGGGTNNNYDTAEDYNCRIEMNNHLVVDRNARTVTARGMVFLLSTTIIDVKSLITLPVGYTPRQPPLLSVDVEDDEDGTHHTVLHFG